MNGDDHRLQAKLAAGQRLDFAEACRLWDLDLLTLGSWADQARRRLNPGNRVTFVIDRNINYTNICISGCRFCAFYRPPGADDGYVLTWDGAGGQTHGTQGPRRQRGPAPGGPQPRIAAELLPGTGSIHPGFRPGGPRLLAAGDFLIWPKNNGLSLEDLLRRLMDAGLSSIPGGGAEILVDRVRQQISPQKCSASQWLEVMAAAHRQGLPTSATMMFGHLETRAERVEHLFKIRELQDAHRRLHRLHPLDLPARGHQPGGRGPGRGGVPKNAGHLPPGAG